MTFVKVISSTVHVRTAVCPTKIQDDSTIIHKVLSMMETFSYIQAARW